MKTTGVPVFILSLLLLAGTSAHGQILPGADAAATAETRSMSAKSVPAKLILGWVENVRLMPSRVLMKAKLDSGAKSSALHAENIEYFDQDGQDMVRFTVLKDHRNPDSERFVYERPLVREVNIKLRQTTTRDVRPVVRLEFCLAGVQHNTLFTLTNRAGFNYPILLGREFLKHEILVDSSESFTHRTRCPRS